MVTCYLVVVKGSGGPEGDRTPCLYYAIVALYQLSYGPKIGLFYHQMY